MARSLPKQNLVIASHNAGKIFEIKQFLKAQKIGSISASELNLKEPEENGRSFYANAMIKAKAAAKSSGLISLADDSGLCVHALGGKPGVFSARWAGPKKNFYYAMKRIETELSDKTDHTAHFVCGLALAWPDGYQEYFEGHVNGTIKFPPTGNLGFGYDPIFCPIGYNITFGQIEPDEKNTIAHRAKAFEKLFAAHQN